MPWKYLRMTRRRTCDTLDPRRKRTEDEAAAPFLEPPIFIEMGTDHSS